MTVAHNLGFPRIGASREMKRAIEAYWQGKLDRAGLDQAGRDLRAQHWALQAEAGLDYVPAGDFSWYDHVLDTSAMLGVVPERFGPVEGDVDLDTYLRMARGRAPTGKDAPACEMTKWFDTNYHYLVPEFEAKQSFRLASSKLFDEVAEAQQLGYKVKPVVLGPLTYLWLGKAKDESVDKLALLERLLPVYNAILARLAEQGVEWVQIDEPILVLDLPDAWRRAFQTAYSQLQGGPKRLLATYFGPLGENAAVVRALPVDGLHIDLVRNPEQLDTVLADWPEGRVLSAGVVNGRNVWRTDLEAALEMLAPVRERLGDRLWVAGSCSLLHSPVDLDREKKLDDELKSWLAFAKQKVREIGLIAHALREGREGVASELAASRAANEARRSSPRIHKPAVRERLSSVTDAMARRNSPYAERARVQREQLGLPLFPTTTIGSFPQTTEIRQARADFRAGRIDREEYERQMREQIAYAVKQQEELGLDVLVHGEAERNDMVEYFGELLDGFAFTSNGWVQSYGSRGVKPPIIFGDVSRPAPMTVEWIQYAQSLTDKPMKGMLTGPVTILQWSFVRDDQPRSTTCDQIALALRDEVTDLEEAGVQVIQMDEPAMREGLPLRQSEWQAYLDWAVRSFRLSTAGAKDTTQIHTHMCYAEFNDIIEAIAALDADVITIETSRSQMELLDAFVDFEYPNEIGPGVFDIHSPRVPDAEEMEALMVKAADLLPVERLWVNPDCGLKTRGWPETEAALNHMVQAAKKLREKYAA